ncbi:MAG: NAD(P)/FAD-dependent oxidoreductase [Fervidicoccaceae archaeon]
MGEDNFIVIGGGPSGAFLARLLSDSGYKVSVYESMPRYSTKPCGMGVPKQIESLLNIPDEFVLSKIRGYRAFIDGELKAENRGELWGWTVDKEGLISYLLEGIDVVKKKYEDYPSKLKSLNNAYVVISNGIYWSLASRDRINAVEVTLEKTNTNFEEDMIEIHFDTSLLGYYWIFPWGEKGINVGVGGQENFYSLIDRLTAFIGSDPRLKGALNSNIVKRIRGAQIISGGIELEKTNPVERVFAVGESIGSVFPLTGEGIRTSMMSSRILYESINNNINYRKLMEGSHLYFANRLQARVLRSLRKMPRELRRKLMKSVPKEWLVKFGLGDFTQEALRRALGKSGFFFDLLRTLGI